MALTPAHHKMKLYNFFNSLLIGIFVCAQTMTCAQTDVIPFGNGSAVIKQVYSTRLYEVEYRSYLVTWENADVVVEKNPNLVSSDLKAGDKIEFGITRVKGSSGFLICILFRLILRRSGRYSLLLLGRRSML